MDKLGNIAEAHQLNDWLERRIVRGEPWVLYHEPEEQEIVLLQCPAESIRTCTDWAELPTACGYLIAPFAPSEQTPIVFLEVNEAPIYYQHPLTQATVSRDMPLGSEPTASYTADFQTYAMALSSGYFDKLVLARTERVYYGVRPPLVHTLCRALELYPTAYTYMLYTPQTGIWLGSTPELLLSGQGTDYQTMSLAGTLPAREPLEDVVWTDRHRAEQAYVTTYICDALRTMRIVPQTTPTRTVRAGQIAHLRTDISFTLEQEQHIGLLLEALHPTPAVCGLPKAESLAFILEHESIQRAYYSGCLGLINATHHGGAGCSAVYVNLRCMQLDDEHAVLYAGGGLLETSQLQEEWLETERKLQTISSVLPDTILK